MNDRINKQKRQLSERMAPQGNNSRTTRRNQRRRRAMDRMREQTILMENQLANLELRPRVRNRDRQGTRSNPTRRYRSRNPSLSRSGYLQPPTSIGSQFRTYIDYRGRSLKCCIKVSGGIVNNMAVIPVVPSFLGGRIKTIASAFLRYYIKSATLHWVPLCGTDTGNQIAIATVSNCSAVNATTTTIFDYLSQMDANINPIWMPTQRRVVNRVDRKSLPVIPSDRNDVPLTFVVATPTSTDTLSDLGSLFLEMEINFMGASSSPDFSGTTATSTAYTMTSTGIEKTAVAAPLVGVCYVSDETLIDLCEFVTIPNIVTANTPVDLPVLHNDVAVNYDSYSGGDKTIYVVGITLL